MFSATIINIITSTFITLFPVVNPIGTSFILNPVFSEFTTQDQRKIAKTIAIYTFILSFITVVIGEYILQMFGLSIPIVQLAGGIIISKIGWEFMSDKKTKKETHINTHQSINSIRNQLFYPLTFPTTAGAGTISVLLTLTAHNTSKNFVERIEHMGAIMISVLIISILIYIFYSNTSRIISRFGESGKNILNKISAFLVFAVGLNIMIHGLFNVIQQYFS